MVRRLFCKIILVIVTVFSFIAFSGVLYAQGRSDEALEHVKAVQERHTEALMAKAGVIGTAIGLNENNEHDVIVLLERSGVAGIPQELEGIPVHTMVTGQIIARSASDRFIRPVPIGVSTGHPAITAGTIGCRVTDGTDVYALSNNHVYANQNLASIGDSVIQPGTYDGGSSPADNIGYLAAFEPIVFSRKASNEIDAAIAFTTTDLVGNATPDGYPGYGVPNSSIVNASLGQLVQKFGRTTELTHGQVTGINAIANISYGAGKTARFVNQIIIEPGSFSAGGDSGSLIVTDDNNRNPVGLLFAGSSSVTIANRIDLVLGRFDVTIDDSSASAPLSPTIGSISGTVTDPTGGAGISGATVSTNTGQKVTTDSTGAYILSNVPTGTYSVTALAAGFQSQTITSVSVTDGVTTPVDFSLIPATTPNMVFVNSIDYTTQGGKNHDKNLSVAVTLMDDFGDPVANASVSVTLANSTTEQSWSGNGTTGSSGAVAFTLNNAPSGTYTTHVDSVSASGLAWDEVSPENSFIK